MTLLDINDTRGAYPASWYAATANALAPFAPLRGQTSTDLCIIGAGYTGLSAALHARLSGLDVVLIDAQRVGFGASGRNGGQVGSDFNKTSQELAVICGKDDAAKLFAMALAAGDLTRALCAAHAPDARYRPGLVHAVRRASEMSHTRRELDHIQQTYGYDQAEMLDRDALQSILKAGQYCGGMMDHGAGHLHPLRYALGLARACAEAGVRIHETTRAHHIDHGNPAILRTDHGQIRADHVIIATNGYGTGLMRGTAARVMPLNNYIVATEPLGDRAARVLTRDVAVHDSRFVVNYFRLSEDKRLLFGGGESYGYRFPKDIATKVRKPMLNVFPHLEDIRIDYAWGGTLAITMSRLPHLARPAPNILSASGYSGHGVALAGLAGKLMADAISGQTQGLVLLESLPTPVFPGAGALRSPLLTLAMTWYALRDRLGL